MGVNSFRQAKRRLINLVNLTKDKYKYNSGDGYSGIDDPLAKSLGIKVEEHPLQFDYGAYIPAEPPRRPNPIILLDPSSADPEHLNFSYFHEISHHLIRNDGELYGFLNDLTYRNEDFDNLIDRFANIGAAEFLIPSEDMFSELRTRSFSIQLLPELDQKFPASKPAIAIQLAQCAPHRCFVLVCQFGLLPTAKEKMNEIGIIEQNESKPKLYVQYASNSPSQDKYSIGKYSLIPEGHLLFTAYKQQKFLTGRDYIPFKNLNKNWIVNCEALYYKGKVYGAFNITLPPPVSTLQPSLF